MFKKAKIHGMGNTDLSIVNLQTEIQEFGFLLNENTKSKSKNVLAYNDKSILIAVS